MHASSRPDKAALESVEDFDIVGHAKSLRSADYAEAGSARLRSGTDVPRRCIRRRHAVPRG
jgi:hypothetical protein